MEINLTANHVVCPKCGNDFENNKINGIAFLELIHSIQARQKMHCRLTLNTLERELGTKTLPPGIKKAILDGYNDLARDICASIGLDAE